MTESSRDSAQILYLYNIYNHRKTSKKEIHGKSAQKQNNIFSIAFLFLKMETMKSTTCLSMLSQFRHYTKYYLKQNLNFEQDQTEKQSKQ